ncbi:MAG: thiamine diphosphokinase [Sarcina sp.]
MKFLVVAAGDRPSKNLFLSYVKDCDKCLAVDRGFEIFYDNEIEPDYIVGDFDSIDEKYKNEIDEKKKIGYPKEKDYTDSDIAISVALEQGATEIILLGMTGGRIDHFLGNIGLLDKALKHNVKAYIIDEVSKMFLVNRNITLSGNYGEVFSLYAYTSEVRGLTIKNAKYELLKYDLDAFESLCNSNEFLDKDIEVSFDEGKLLVIYSKE